MKGSTRVGLGVIDQGLSSVSNALFLVVVARVATVEEFGAVSLAYALFVFGLAVQRASIGTLTSLATAKGHPFSMGVPLLAALVIVTVGMLLRAVIGLDDYPAFYVILLGTFLFYPQDLLRYVSIAQRRVGQAVVSDAIWFAVTLTLFCVSLGSSRLSVDLVVGFWVVLGAGSALAAIAAPMRRDLALRTGWLKAHGHELRFLGPEAVLSAVAPLVLASVLAHYMSLEDVAAVRGAGTILGPVSTLFAAIQVVLLPEMARILGEHRVRMATAQAVLMSVLVLVWGGCFLLLPDDLGRQILGATWTASRAVLVWATLELVIWALGSGSVALLTSYRRWQALLAIRAVYLVAVACALGLTVPSGDVTDVMVGMVVASAITCTLLFLAAKSLKRRSAALDA
jgi:O-antigen/teichoic acid export membrane protein